VLAASCPPGTSDQPNVFRRDADYWTLAFAGRTCRLKHSKGLAYLAALLASAGEELHVGELAGLVEGPVREERSVVDRDVRRAYRVRATGLQEALEDAERSGDTARALRAREELDVLAGEIATAYRLDARLRASDDPIERARKAVGNRIRADLVRIERAHPELWQHLSRAVRTGTFCAYRPERPTVWQL
jgi:hypothetical protein